MNPEGPTDPTIAPVEVVEGRTATVTLMAPGWWPPVEQVTQSYGICFTDDGKVVLAAWAPGRFNLPGGTIESGESPEDALIREVAEEACATVIDCEYLASQHVWDPDDPNRRHSYFQSRWWARIRLDEWDPQHEMIERIAIEPDDFLTTLYWEEKRIAARLFELALAVEGR